MFSNSDRFAAAFGLDLQKRSKNHEPVNHSTPAVVTIPGAGCLSLRFLWLRLSGSRMFLQSTFEECSGSSGLQLSSSESSLLQLLLSLSAASSLISSSSCPSFG